MQHNIVKVAILATTFAAGLFAMIPATATAALGDRKRKPQHLDLQVENDVFNRFSPTIRDYTNGVRIGWLSRFMTADAAGIVALTTIPTFFLGEPQSDSEPCRVGVSFGQNIYTPNDTFTSQPISNDGPYAAWLYASFALQYTYKRRRPEDRPAGSGAARYAAARPRRDRSGGGRRVRAEQFPQFIGVARANRWANQLHNEPTMIGFERRWRICPRRLIQH